MIFRTSFHRICKINIRMYLELFPVISGPQGEVDSCFPGARWRARSAWPDWTLVPGLDWPDLGDLERCLCVCSPQWTPRSTVVAQSTLRVFSRYRPCSHYITISEISKVFQTSVRDSWQRADPWRRLWRGGSRGTQWGLIVETCGKIPPWCPCSAAAQCNTSGLRWLAGPELRTGSTHSPLENSLIVIVVYIGKCIILPRFLLSACKYDGMLRFWEDRTFL